MLPALATCVRNASGPEWRQHFSEFDETPFASASIGQVHRGLRQDGDEVALKIQYPGVADSINSDIDNLNMVLKLTGLFPKGATGRLLSTLWWAWRAWRAGYHATACCSARG